jgi:hypothetical protein
MITHNCETLQKTFIPLKGIKIDFISDPSAIEDGASFNFDDYVHSSEALMQNSLINSFLQRGTDKLNPNRGTDLISDSLKFNVFANEELIHIGNFAASDTMEYINSDILGFAVDSPIRNAAVDEDEIASNVENDEEPNREETVAETKSLENLDEPLLKTFTLSPKLGNTNNIIYNTILSTSKNEEIGKDSILPILL